MPVNKDALKRYRIIDEILSDPYHDYTTRQICHRVNHACDSAVSLRMIQKDIKALNEEFGKALVKNEGGRGTVRYEDQSTPVFSKKLTSDEQQVLREMLRTLGQFEGLENFTWLDLLKKRLDVDKSADSERSLISFGSNKRLQIPHNLLGRLYTAISRRQVIGINYHKGFEAEATYLEVYPYQLRQYNDRWFLIATPIKHDKPDFIGTYPLDRIEEQFDYLEGINYVETHVDINARFDEIVGVTYMEENDVEDITFAVRQKSVDYVRTKFIHDTQIEYEGDDLESFRHKYPSLSDCFFFSIECRPNYELTSRLASFGDNLIVVEPKTIRQEIKDMLDKVSVSYAKLSQGL